MKSRNKNFIATLLVALLSAGCASTKRIASDETRRAPKKPVDIYDLYQVPPKRYKEIAALSFLGARADQSKASRYFIKEAKRLGADGIIMYGTGVDYPKGRGVFGPGGSLIGFGPDFVFKASAI